MKKFLRLLLVLAVSVVALAFIAAGIFGVMHAISILTGPHMYYSSANYRIATRASGALIGLGFGLEVALLHQLFWPSLPDPWRERWRREAKKNPRRPLPDIRPAPQPNEPPYQIDKVEMQATVEADLARIEASVTPKKR